jgi:hypothetical protein
VRLTFVSGNLRVRINNFALKNANYKLRLLRLKKERISFSSTYSITGNERTQKNLLESETKTKKINNKVKTSLLIFNKQNKHAFS